MALRFDLDDRYDNLTEFQISTLHGVFGITVNFHASVFSPFCPSVTCVFSAVQLIVSVWNSGTSWRNWTGTESTMKMSADDLGNFSRMLDNANECNISLLVLNVQELNQAPPYESPSGLDPIIFLDWMQFNQVLKNLKLMLMLCHSLHHALTHPSQRADVNKALFEARLQSLDDTGLKYPWESGVMGDFSETNDAAGLPTLPIEYLSFTEQLYSTATASAPRSTLQRVSGRDLELPFYSFCNQSQTRQGHVC